MPRFTKKALSIVLAFAFALRHLLARGDGRAAGAAGPGGNAGFDCHWLGHGG